MIEYRHPFGEHLERLGAGGDAQRQHIAVLERIVATDCNREVSGVGGHAAQW